MGKNRTAKINRGGGGVATPAAPPRATTQAAQGRRARPQPFSWAGFARAHRDGLCMAALALLAFAVFAHCLPYAFIDFDTADFIQDNPHVRNGLSLSAIRWAFVEFTGGHWTLNFLSGYWTPLAWLTHQLDCQLYGLNPWGHHLSSLLIHAANAALLFLALRRMSGAFWRSAFVAAVFAIHPLRVESVVWIAERKDVLSAFFLILTLLAYERYCRGEFSPRKYGWVAAGMMLGLATKPSVVTLPCLLLLLDFWPLRRWPARDGAPEPGQARPASLPVLLAEKAPLFLVTVIFSALTYYAQDSQDITMKLPMAVRLSNATLNYLDYLGKTFWPFSLAIIYPVSKTLAPMARLFPAALILAALSLGAALAWRRRPYLTVGWCWFLGLLVPMIGIIQVGAQSTADRYSYLSQSGLIIALAWGGAELAGRLRIPRRAMAATVGVILLLLAVRTAHQVTYWRDDIPLWEHTLRVTRNNLTANLNYGYLLGKKGQLDEAITHLEAALALDARDLDSLTNLGIAYASKGNFSKAEEYFHRALEIKPNHYLVHFNLAMLAGRQRDTQRALVEFETAARIAPENPNPMIEIAKIWVKQGDNVKIAAALREALRRARANNDTQLIKTLEKELAGAPPS